MGKISPACKAAAKKKFEVWPSAYASGWGVRCTKAGGPGKMGKKKKKRSPLNQADPYEKLTSRFPQFNQATDTVVSGSSTNQNFAKMKSLHAAQRAALSLSGVNSANIKNIGSAQKAEKTTRKTNTGEYTTYQLYDKDKLKKAVSPLEKKSKVKGGGTSKVCLPAAKVKSMSAAEKKKVIAAKKSAAAKGDYKRSSKSNVKGARKKGATLRDWFENENWINVATGEPCGK